MSFIYTCWHRKLDAQKLLVLYFTCLGSIIGMNAVLYFLSSLFDYIPIQWNHGTSFLRNLFLHFLLTISMYFKFTESVESKFSIDYEQIYFTYGIFYPLLLLIPFVNIFVSKAWSYYLVFVTIPLILNTAPFRRMIFGIGVCKKLIVFIQYK